MADPQVTQADLDRGLESVLENMKIAESAQTKKSMVDAFGDAGYHEEDDGSWTYTVPTNKTKEVDEMLAPQRRLMAARGEKVMGRRPQTMVRRRDGKKVWIYAENEELACRTLGSKPIMQVRGMLRVRSARELGIADSDELYRETGRGDWEPTGKPALTSPWPWQKGGG